MDNLTHSLFGLTLARTALGRGGRASTIALVLASNAPDIDIVATAGGSAKYLEWHRGPTHGLPGVIGLGLWCGMLWSVVARAIRAVRALRADAAGASDVTLALTTAVITMLIPFLATNGFSLGFPWLLIGLLGVSVRRAVTASASASVAAPLVPQSADAT